LLLFRLRDRAAPDASRANGEAFVRAVADDGADGLQVGKEAAACDRGGVEADAPPVFRQTVADDFVSGERGFPANFAYS